MTSAFTARGLSSYTWPDLSDKQANNNLPPPPPPQNKSQREGGVWTPKHQLRMLLQTTPPPDLVPVFEVKIYDYPSGDIIIMIWFLFTGSGKSFGEVALIDERNLRGASVIAEEVSDMIVVDRNLYTRSLKAAHKKDLAERISFVEKHPLFGWGHLDFLW